MKYYVGIDLGGTNIVAGVVDEGYHILSKVSTPTNAPQSCESYCKVMADLVKEAIEKADLKREDISWVGIGAPGPVDQKNGVLSVGVNLGLKNAPIAAELSKLCLLPVILENDANAAAYGEYVAGCGKGSKSMIAVTIGTGIGGGIILDDKIVSGAFGGGAELGHMVIRVGGRPCNCGRKGCMETYVSATGLIRSAKEALEQKKQSRILELVQGEMDRINAKVIFDAAHENDETALEILEQYYEDMSEGLANIINMLQPEILCIGGGMSAQGEYLLAPIREKTLKKLISRDSAVNTNIIPAVLGNDAGLIGAACLGNQL